jgi:hypothetical protein
MQELSKSKAVQKQDLQGASFSGTHNFTLGNLELSDIEPPVIRSTKIVIRSIRPPARPTAAAFLGREKGNSRQHPAWRALFKLIDERERLHIRFNV